MGLAQNLGLQRKMDNFAQDIIENLSKMDLTADIAQKSCLKSDLKLSHILQYIKCKKCK